MLFQTGIDRGASETKTVTLLVFPWLSYYRVRSSSSPQGRRIHLIPSHRILLKRLPEEITHTEEAESYVREEILAFLKGREALWKLWWENGRARVLVAEPEEELPRGGIWEAEPVALTRAFLTTGLREGELLDFGRRKITLVRIRKGKLSGFRCFLNGDGEADFGELPGPLVLSGGGSLDPAVEKLFSGREIRRIAVVPPEKVSAFGAALWGVLGRDLPAFRSYFGEIPPEQATRTAKSLLVAMAVSGFFWTGLRFWVPRLQKNLKARQKALFAHYYPGTPAVAPLKQIRTLILESRKPTFQVLLKEALEGLPHGTQLLEISFENGGLKIKVEVPEEKAKDLPGKLSEVKKLPGGTEIVTLEFNREGPGV